MMTIETYVSKSTVCDGLGLFAGEKISTGTVIWTFVENFDIKVHISQVDKMLLAQRKYVDKYFWREGDYLYSSCDNSNFQNHSKNPNSVSRGDVMVAARDIEIGEEILVDYSSFDDDWDTYSCEQDWAAV